MLRMLDSSGPSYRHCVPQPSPCGMQSDENRSRNARARARFDTPVSGWRINREDCDYEVLERIPLLAAQWSRSPWEPKRVKRRAIPGRATPGPWERDDARYPVLSAVSC